MMLFLHQRNGNIHAGKGAGVGYIHIRQTEALFLIHVPCKK